MKRILNHISRFKYLYTLILLGIWMVFFDQNRLSNHLRLHRSLSNLQKQKAFYETEIKRNQAISELLTNDTAFIEQYGREKYLLKKDNEVLYLIVRE
jgi:cell division protein DivIC